MEINKFIEQTVPIHEVKNVKIFSKEISTIKEYENIYEDSGGSSHSDGFVLFLPSKDYTGGRYKAYPIKQEITDQVFKL